MKNLILAAFAAAMTLGAMPAHAALLVDDGPTSDQLFPYLLTNRADDQNFLMRFTLAADARIDGMDIFSAVLPRIGQAVTIKLRADEGGAPAGANLATFATSLSAITQADGPTGYLRAHADFAPYLLAAGTYWIGMSGTASDLGILSWIDDGPAARDDQRALSGESVVRIPAIHNIAFALYGTNAVPEPASWALMILGFAAMGAAARRRTNQRRALA